MDELIDPTGIAEVGRLHVERLGDDLSQLCHCLVGEEVVIALEQLEGDLHELVGGVVVELVAVGETSLKAGVRVEHGIHLFLIAREDDQHVGVGLCEDGE